MPRAENVLRVINRNARTIGTDELKTRLPVRRAGHDCFACSSKAHGIFNGLDPMDTAELDRLRQAAVYPGGAILFAEGDVARAIYCVCAGRVKLSSTSAEGRAVILGIAVPGDVLAIRPVSLETAHDTTAETLDLAHVCLIPRHGFLAFLEHNPGVSLALVRKLCGELGDAYRQVRGAVLKQASERLTETLLTLCETFGRPTPDGISLRIDLSQDELASLAGMSRRSLNRVLARLRREGIIESRGRSILVRDSEALRSGLAVSLAY